MRSVAWRVLALLEKASTGTFDLADRGIQIVSAE